MVYNRDQYWPQALKHLYMWSGWWNWEHPHQVCWWHQIAVIVVRWTPQKGERSYRDTCTGGNNGLGRTVCCLTKMSEKSCTWDRITNKSVWDCICLAEERSYWKGPGVVVVNKLNTSQCTAAATEANQILESKDRGIIIRDTDTVILLLSAFVRPQLEYCV